ncbi:lactoylglutathione lyase [Tissierella creatinophila]|uniref:Aldoketomutase n=1 Tax=Tissierella creatinophila DSM 6911 TaxID=1123403 RepID=A0A1U7M6X2_TISCR|nr:VOC family protein [Tissierella creatinophila]OLS02959.1 lactoylglutathione lyase [Tissierella creatinophila DSM 6911]
MKTKMLHTCIRVMDLEKSLKFYKDALGLIETRRKDIPEDKFTLVFLSDEEGAYELELTYNYNPQKPYEIGNGFSHIAVSVDDLEASRERHKEMGYKVTDLMGLRGERPRFYFVTDPDGYDVEVIRAEK